LDSSDTPATPADRRKRLVVIADNSLIVEAICIGLRKSGEFTLVGHADPRRASASTVVSVRPDVIILDDMGRSEGAIAFIRDLVCEAERLSVIVLSVDMDQEWLARAFDAGAVGAISKATQPAALATLLRETLNGHICHRLAQMRPTVEEADPAVNGDLPLTSRELEILQLVAAGLTNVEVARKLWVTEQTVKFHLRNIYRKLDVANRTEASHFAHLNGLVRAAPSRSPLTIAS
jgi:DNA-binding NarL/FixJ family response regulator